MKTVAEGIHTLVKNADCISDLNLAHEEIDKYIKQVFPELHLSQVRGLFNEINSLHFSIKAKALKLAADQQNILEDDYFCWGMMGSGAREEQTVRTDQDNCIFYDNNSSEHDIFAFSSAGVKHLAAAGYPLCSGNVMATNPRWNFPSSFWNDQHVTLKFEDVRYAYILLDATPIYGNPALLNNAKDKWIQALCNDSSLLLKMRDTASNLHVPISPLGKIFTERYGKSAGKFNIKTSAYAPLIIAVKYLSLVTHVKEVNTYRRIECLEQRGIIDERLARQLASALDVILFLRLGNSVVTPFEEIPDDNIDIQNMTKENLQRLKKGLKSVKRLQRIVRKWGVNYEASR